MNRISQQLGQVKWYTDQLMLLQSEPIKAIDALFAHFPSCVISGCEVSGSNISPGLISFVWVDGVKKSMVVPFAGANSVSFPKYFLLQKTDLTRFYENGGTKVFSENYEAVLSDTIPSGPYFQILSNGTTVRLLDAFQSAAYRFVSDAEKQQWNSNLPASTYSADDVFGKVLSKLSEIHRFVSDDEKTAWNNKITSSALSPYALLAGAAFTGHVSSITSIVAVSSNTVLDASHNGKIIEASGAITITLPNSMPAGFQVDIVNVGSGIVTLAASGTLQTKSGYVKLAHQYGGASCYCRSVNTWLAVGDLTQ